MKRVLPLVLLSVATVFGGVVQGIILESYSGLPLARTVVRLQPIPQSSGAALQVLQTRANRTGGFLFADVTPGIYLVIATRDGYFPAAFGQRRPDGQGTPVEITKDSALVSEIRMRRKGAITGRVLDENGVGLAGVPVVAYHARLPLRSAGRGIADDRGVYRIPFLDPGKYWIRSAAHILEDGSGLLPTFGRESYETRQSIVHTARIDAETPDADVRPFPGNLFSLSGIVSCPAGDATITLSSETGRKSTQAGCGTSYQFQALAPGDYEVFGTTSGGLAGFMEISLSRNTNSGTIDLRSAPRVDVESGQPGVRARDRVNIPVKLIGRRHDLSDIEELRELTLPDRLLPGNWEMTARVGPNQFVESIVNQGGGRRRERPDKSPDAFEVFISPQDYARLRVNVSEQAAHIAGTVVTRDKNPVAGAPVFLWPVTPEARRSLGGVKQTLSDTSGGYRFDSLPPGDYRLLATFDATFIDEELIEAAQAMAIRVELGKTLMIELPLWIAP
ncbi:MAG TPA: carboxypeptidase-like regulatory domain-containing protein [Bryobacteraceae bacterium]|jgi:protocatechuate 3,4-dioxygenase beta subunit|nr:carboxypeptidase-like regulatory domain-containing protein [Bryobacteraceae bacterium]